MRILVLMLGGLTLVTVSISVGLWGELRAEREQHPEPQLQSNFAMEHAVDAALSVQPAAATASQTSDKPAPSANSQPDGRIAGQLIKQILANDAALLQDPEYRAASAARLRLTISQDYPGLIDALGLSPGEASKLFELLAGFQSEKQDASARSSFVPFTPESQSVVEELMRTRQGIERRRQEALATLLGNARHEQFKEYEAARPARAKVDALGRTLASAGQALSAAQTGPLQAAFIADEKRKREESVRRVAQMPQGGAPDAARITEAMRVTEADLERATESNRQILAAVQPHLSDQQLAIYRALLDQQLAQTRAAARVNRERVESQSQ